MRRLRVRMLNSISILIALLVLPGAMAGGGPPGGDVLANLRSAWVESLEKGDIESSVALFTPDAVFLSPDGARFDDRAAIRTLYRSVVATYRSHIGLISKKEECADTICVDQGTYSETLTETATGKKSQLTGSYLFVGRRQPDGSWKISEMVWTGGLGGPR